MFKKRVNELIKEECERRNELNLYIDELSCVDAMHDTKDEWYEKIYITGAAILFKLDPGANCNVLQKKVVEAIGATIKLAETKQLVTYNDGRI